MKFVHTHNFIGQVEFHQKLQNLPLKNEKSNENIYPQNRIIYTRNRVINKKNFKKLKLCKNDICICTQKMIRKLLKLPIN